MADQIDRQPAEYLGDGVYAIHHGDQIELRANDAHHPSDVIYLEDNVLEALNRFDSRIKTNLKDPT